MGRALCSGHAHARSLGRVVTERGRRVSLFTLAERDSGRGEKGGAGVGAQGSCAHHEGPLCSESSQVRGEQTPRLRHALLAILTLVTCRS